MHLILPDALAVITIRLEADHEPFEGKVGVGNVIRNRMKYKYQSDGTVAGTVLWPGQFSAFNTFYKLRPILFNAQVEDPKTADAIRAWQESAKASVVGKSVLYFSPKAMSPPGSKPGWLSKVRHVKTISNHLFYEDPILDGKEE